MRNFWTCWKYGTPFFQLWFHPTHHSDYYMYKQRVCWLVNGFLWSRQRCKVEVLVGADGLSLSRKGSLSCHTCCDRGPRLFRSRLKTRRLKDRPIHLPCPTSKGYWRPMFTLCSSSFCKCNKIKLNHSWSVTGHPVTSKLCALFSIHSKMPREREDNFKACIKSYLSYMI